MCYNLGADVTANPQTPGWEIIRNYYQWGRLNASTAGPFGSLVTEADSGDVLIWNTLYADAVSWQDGVKHYMIPVRKVYVSMVTVLHKH